jgi:hypothetical protein
VAWGSQDCDLDCLRYILKSAKAEHLLPPSFRCAAQPLAWWRRLRHQLGLTANTLPLNLANLYGTVFPEDRKLTLEAHDAGAGVSMAYRLAIAYLRLTLDMHLPGKIDSWLSPTMKSVQSGWRICDEEANDFLTRLQEAGVGNDQTDEVMNDGEDEEEGEIDLSFHEIFSDVEDEELRDSNEDGGDLDNHFHSLGSDIDGKEETWRLRK